MEFVRGKGDDRVRNIFFGWFWNTASRLNKYY